MRRRVFALVGLLVVIGCAMATMSAQAEGKAEVELIIDYLDRLQVTVIMPADVDPVLMVDRVSAMVGSPLQLISDWDEEEGLHVWLYSAPKLIQGKGLQKVALWDCSQLADIASQLGLSDGVNLFVVSNQPSGALHYDVYINDRGEELPPAAADDLEVWWGFGLTPAGTAPELSVLLWLRPVLNWATLSPVWIPLVGSLLVLLIVRSKSRKMAVLANVVAWFTVWISLLLSFLMQWQAVGNFLLGSTDGWAGRLTFVLTLMIPLAWSILLVRVPLFRALTRRQGRAFDLKVYLLQSLRSLLILAVLLVVGMSWLMLAQYLQQFGLWLALFSGLAASGLALWLTAELAPLFAWGRQAAADLGAEAMIRSLAGRMRIPPPSLHFIPRDKANQANAFASGTIVRRVYVTQLLWDSLNRSEQQFILAHELAHQKRSDPLRLLFSLLIPAWLVVIAGALILLVDADWTLAAAAGMLVLSFLVTFLLSMPYRRRAELMADHLALQATGDLPAAISALQRVVAINQRRSLKQNRLTHPRLDLRLQALCQAKSVEDASSSQAKEN